MLDDTDTATLEQLLVAYVVAIRELRSSDDTAAQSLVDRLERRLLAVEAELAARAARDDADGPAAPEPAPGIP